MTRHADPPCASMHFLEEERLSLRSRLPFVGAALAFHLVLFALTFPEMADAAPPERPRLQCPVAIRKWTPPPPPVTLRKIEKPRLTRGLPVPDPKYDCTEPRVEPTPLEFPDEFDDLALSAPVARTAAPPALQPLIPGTMGVGMPRLIEETKVRPTYPELARRAGIDARVILRAIVRRSGEVGAIEILSESPPGFGFGESALEAVRQWRYEPARLGSRPVDVSMSVVVRFTVD